MLFQSHYAHQLFYGKQDATYPSDYPHNFTKFYTSCNNHELDFVIENLLEFLHFIGIKIRKEFILNHLSKYPNDFPKLIRKSYYILKTLAHHADRVNINNPYQDNNGDIFFLLRIESGESITGGQLNLFEDLELPDLYRKIANLLDGYEEDTVAQKLNHSAATECFR